MGKSPKQMRIEQILIKQVGIKSKWEKTKNEKLQQVTEEKFYQSLTKKEQFIDDYFTNFSTSKSHNKEYFEKIRNIVDNRNITEEEYLKKTGAPEREYYWRLLNDIPSLKTLVAFSIVFNIDTQNLYSLLHSLGLTFKLTDPLQYAYFKLVENFRGLNIQECNEYLKAIGVTNDNDLLPDIIGKNAKK